MLAKTVAEFRQSGEWAVFGITMLRYHPMIASFEASYRNWRGGFVALQTRAPEQVGKLVLVFFLLASKSNLFLGLGGTQAGKRSASVDNL